MAERAPVSAAFEAERHRGRLIAVARRILGDEHEAEDVAQEALLRASGRRDIASLEGWLVAVACRLAVDRVRARARRDRAHAAAPLREEPRELEDARTVRAKVEELPEPYRRAVTLRYLEGLDFPELARRLGTIERTARTWVGRGLAKLRERL